MTRMSFVTAIFLLACVIQGIKSEQCPEKNGRFPLPGQCDAYIECKDGIAEEKLCPDGLLFNEKLSPEGECQYAPSVNCLNRPRLQPANATEDCPHQFGFYRIGDEVNCGEYMNCAHGEGKLTKCPDGLAFNKDTYRCDWPGDVEDCNAEKYLNFHCPTIQKDETLLEKELTDDDNDDDDDDDNNNNNNNKEKPDDIRYYPKTCSEYFVCVNGKPRLYSCSKNLVFNPKTNLCDHGSNVPECKKMFGKVPKLEYDHNLKKYNILKSSTI